MHDHELLTEDELGSDLEFESFEFETGRDLPGEVEEMELVEELLAVSSEQEMDQFLGKLFTGAWKGIKQAGRVVGKVARPLGGILKGVAKTALPFVGGALGSFIPIPGVGTALGSALGGAAASLLEVDLEGMSQEDQEFELARRFVRLASNAAARAADARGRDEELDGELSTQAANAAAVAALQGATRQLKVGQKRAQPRKQSGRWVRQGNNIIIVGG